MLNLIVGCVSSGKTTELVRRLNRACIAKRVCVLVRWTKDTKPFIHSVNPECAVIFVNTLSDLTTNEANTEIMSRAEVIGIDEGQFFEDIVNVCATLALNKKMIFVAALDTTWRGVPFDNIAYLLTQSETITKFTAICIGCGSDNAIFSKRLVSSTDLILVGGHEAYVPHCRKCFNERA